MKNNKNMFKSMKARKIRGTNSNRLRLASFCIVSCILLSACTEEKSLGTSDMVKLDPNKNQSDVSTTEIKDEDGRVDKIYAVDEKNKVNDKKNDNEKNKENDKASFYDRYAEGKITLKELGGAVASVLQDSYWPNQEMEESEIEEKLGITKDQYKNCYFEYAHLKDNLDQLVLVQCKDKEISNVAFALEKYRDDLIMNHQNQPINYAKANASRIEIIDEYVCFVLLGGNLDVVEEEENRMAYCTEQNEKAIDTLEKILCN